MAKRWYSVSVLSNYENKVAEAIREAARLNNEEYQAAFVRILNVAQRERRQRVIKQFGPQYVQR